MKNYFSGRATAWVFVVTLVAIALFLRLYHREYSMFFGGDQGNLLAVGQKILTSGHFPMVGPVVSIDGLHIAPLNFYLVAFFQLFSFDPLDIGLWYVGINIAAGLLLFLYARLLYDTWTGVAALYFFPYRWQWCDMAQRYGSLTLLCFFCLDTLCYPSLLPFVGRSYFS